MSDDTSAPARTPWLTLAVQVMGAIGVFDGVRIIIGAARCDGHGCTSVAVGILAVIWGVIAIAAGIRGRIGFVALVLAIVLPLVISWAWFFLGIMFLLVVSVTAAMSKGQLAPYYRWHKEATP
jgi:hypothetical protein